ncbi:MAG: permease-like cell division protein FtsX [Clostridia bacterium]|nr:permease-like cell division protein FtsX [Clostridia bacterium]
MNARSGRYLIGEGFKNVWVNRLMSFASIGVLVACMLIMGVALCLTQNINAYLGVLSEQDVVMVYFDDDLDEAAAKALFEKIKKVDNVDPKATVFKAKDPALESLLSSLDLSEDQQSLFTEYLDGNPLPDGVEVHVLELEKMPSSIKKLKALKGVASVHYDAEVTERITNIRNVVAIVSVGLMLLLLIIAAVIVCNTIRITMFSRKLEISIMKAVGATDRFVRAPFLVEGALLGLFAAIFSTGLLYGIYTVAVIKAAEMLSSSFTLVPFRELALPLFGIFALIGVVIGLLGSYFTIAKYLRKEGSEFRAL